MTRGRISRVGWLALGLALLGSLVALVNEIEHYRHTHAVDWGHVALIFGVPILMYSIVTSRQRQP